MRPDFGPAFPIALLLGGCMGHIELGSIPRRNEPYASRIAAYERLRPRTVTEVRYIHHSSFGITSVSQPMLDHVTLGDGTVVVAPDDLLPAVLPESVTAMATERHLESRRRAFWVFGISGGVAAVGSGIFVVGMASTPYGFSQFPGGGPVLATSIAIAVTGLIGMAVGRIMIETSGLGHRRDAFSGYDRSLRERLGVCGIAGGTIDCDAAAADGTMLVPIERER